MRARSLVWVIALMAMACGSDPGSIAGPGSSIDPGGDKPKDDDPGNNPGPGGGDTDPPKNPDGGTVDAPDTPPQSAPLASSMGIAEIAVFQGVKVAVVKNGAKVATRNAPVVAKREALVRVYATRESGYAGQPITAELHLIGSKTTVLRDTKVISAASADGDLASTFNFEVPGTLMEGGVKIAVALTDPKASGTPHASARYPKTGEELLEAQSSGEQLKVVLVPWRYDADGSQRLPDTSAAQVETYRKAFYGMYPAAKVDITVHAPVPFRNSISSGGNGFSALLNATVSLRQQERPTADVYYYGIFASTTSFQAYCRGGCVLGLSGLGSSPSDAGVRASVGIGFTGAESAGTAAHEVGHAHGRQHAPCGGPAGPDPNFPHAGGSIGVWGYDLTSKKLINPAQAKDFMGYCRPEWISDYNFKRLFERMKYVNGATLMKPGPEKTYRVASMDTDGALEWGEAFTTTEVPQGIERIVTFLGPDNAVVGQATAHYFEYDHLPGGFYIVPEAPLSALKMRMLDVSTQKLLELARPR